METKENFWTDLNFAYGKVDEVLVNNSNGLSWPEKFVDFLGWLDYLQRRVVPLQTSAMGLAF